MVFGFINHVVIVKAVKPNSVQLLYFSCKRQSFERSIVNYWGKMDGIFCAKRSFCFQKNAIISAAMPLPLFQLLHTLMGKMHPIFIVNEM
jgi:hypothetical protein